MDDAQTDRAQAQLRGHIRSSERDLRRVATFKDDGHSAVQGNHPRWFGELIAAIEVGQVDVFIVRDIDRLARNLT